MPLSNCSKCHPSPQKGGNFPERGFEPSTKIFPALNMVDYTTTAKNFIQIQCSFINPSIYFSAEKSTFYTVRGLGWFALNSWLRQNPKNLKFGRYPKSKENYM